MKHEHDKVIRINGSEQSNNTHPKIATMFSFSLPYCAIVAKKEASEKWFT